MKKIFTIMLMVLSIQVFSQVSNTKVVRIANATTTFSQPLSEGNILIDINTDKSYMIIKAIAGTASLSTLTLDVDYKEYIDRQDISGIATNTTNISTNETNITTNTSSILLNTAHNAGDNDLSEINEGSLSVAVGTATTSIINSNTNGSEGITITAAGINSIEESGNVITITATELQSAGDIDLTDEGNLYTGTEVETALQEVGDSITALRADIGTGDGTTTSLPADSIIVDTIGGATNYNVQDWLNTTQSAGIISGGTITNNGNGTVTITAGTGIIKTTNSSIGENQFFDWDQTIISSLVDNNANYICIDYNSGEPQIISSTANTANGHTSFNVGKLYKEGSNIDVINSGLQISDFTKRTQQHQYESMGIHIINGAVVGETGTRNLSITAGIMYAGLNRMITDAINTSTGNDFEYYYYNGSNWVESDETQINNLQYNDLDDGLSTLSNREYGIHWVYKGTSNNTFVVYGTDSYRLKDAQAAQPPTFLPSHVENVAVLRAKIIIKKDEDSFAEIKNTENAEFTGTSVSDHNYLTDLQGGTADEYYHLTAAEYNSLVSSTIFGTPDVGVLYISGAGVINHTVADTYYSIDVFSTGSANNMTATSSTLTIPATALYDLRFHISCTHATNNTVVNAAVFIDDVENAEIKAERKIGTGGDYGNYAGGGILSLTAGDVIKLKTKASLTGNQTINAANFSIKRIN